ncbi:response regulator [Anaerolineae bacterium CFX9]|nr:response regulator [Anaerolineae bacterium CFX9]
MAGELILVVDDGQEMRDFIVDTILHPNGYRSLQARDGRDGFEKILQHQPDLVLLDYQLPRMNGIEVLEAMRARGIETPVILMTFYGSEEVAIEVYRMGVRDYVKKPFTVDEMLFAIERTLNEVRLRREKEALTERLLSANRELQLRVQELNVLYSVGKSVTALMELDQLLPLIVDAAVRLTGGEEGFLHLAQRDKLICSAIRTLKQPRAEATALEVTDRMAEHVIQTSQPALATPEKPKRGAPTSVAMAPLTLRDRVVGVLGVRNVTEAAEPFSKHDLALLSALTDYAAISIQNARNVEQLRQNKENEKARIRSLFQRFVPPQVVDQVIDNPDSVQLGGKRKEVTVLFADLRGYTSFSENLQPERVVEMLNDYLSLAANVMMSYGGTLDKYMGDGLMAIFNAPDDNTNHLQNAVESALTLQQAARQLEQQRGDGLAFSIGIHFGEAVVGFIGTDCAMNYTAVGDAVNLAKRLQEAAKPGQILVEEAVVQRLNGKIQAEALGELKVRNRKQPAQAYALKSLATR